MYFVYAIQNLSKKRIYIGHTRDFNKRLQYHNAGYVKSTSDDRPWVLVALDEFKTKSKARWIERELKRSSNKRKKWISQNKVDITQQAPPRREGKGRQYKKEFRQFLYIARGSVFEVVTLSEIFRRRKLFLEEENKEIKENLEIPENYQVQTKKKQDVPEKKVNVWDAESPEPEVKENKNQKKEERSDESSTEDPEKSEDEKENDLDQEKEHVEEPWHEPETEQENKTNE